MLIIAVRITQQTWRCGWYLDPSSHGTKNLAAMLRSPRKLPSSKTPCQGLAGTLTLLGTSSMVAPAPSEAHGELNPSTIPVISALSQ